MGSELALGVGTRPAESGVGVGAIVTTLSVSSPPYTVPSYSLTGDLLAYLKCGLQYRYQNRGSLPPSIPVQLWFGQFIHAVMEESFLRWRDDPTHRRFPWSWEDQIRPIELEIDRRLVATGLTPPPQLFCRSDGVTPEPRCTCADPVRDGHRLLASKRAEQLIQTWGAHLFSLVNRAEVNIRGIRPIAYAGPRRAEYYEVSGTIDVLSSVEIAAAPPGNLLLHELQAVDEIADAIAVASGDRFEVILDYKGARRPSTLDREWSYIQWQLHTYAWLREQQEDASEVVAGVLLFANELEPSQQDMRALQRDLSRSGTDVRPTGRDASLVSAWRPRNQVPNLSRAFLERRSLMIVPINRASIATFVGRFDGVVEDIERSVQTEMSGSGITASWQARPSGGPYSAPEPETCTACDHKHYCPLASAVGYGTLPVAP
jgi:hypothetical protein